MSTLTITTFQTYLYWENKAANLAMLEDKIRAADPKTELAILPEMFTTGFSMNPGQLAETMDGPTVQWMHAMAKQHRLIIAGSFMASEGEQFFNRMVWMQPNGVYGTYDKRHRFTLASEGEHFSHGHKRLIASVKGWRVLVQICYDLRFPVWSRQQIKENGEAEYDLLVYVANWPERRIHAWKTLLQARAIENQCYVVGVNRIGMDGHQIYHSGDTMVVDPMGEVLYAKTHEEDVHTITLNRADLVAIREKLPFLRDADSFDIHP
jgi:omega-amidase